MTESDEKLPKENESDKKYRILQQIVNNYQKIIKIIKNTKKNTQIAEIWTCLTKYEEKGKSRFWSRSRFWKKFSGIGIQNNRDPGINPGIPQGPAVHGRHRLLHCFVAAPQLKSWQYLSVHFRLPLGSTANFWQFFNFFYKFWQFLATFGNFWKLLATFDNFWQILTYFDNFWQLLTTFDILYHFFKKNLLFFFKISIYYWWKLLEVVGRFWNFWHKF